MSITNEDDTMNDDAGALPWKFSQCFGEKTVVEEMTEGKKRSFQII